MRRRASVTAPLILIAIGVLFLIHAISPEYHIGQMLAVYWPFLLIAWGVIALAEVCILALRGNTLPVNGISGGGWFLVIVICIVGLTTFEVRKSTDTWWRQMGWENGVEAFGEEHEFPIDSIEKPVGKAPHVVIETFRGDAKITPGNGAEVTVAGHKTVRSFDSGEADRSNTAAPVEVIVEGNTVTVRCNQDKASSHAPVTTDLEISVPKDASIEASGVYGDFDISGLSGNVNISSDNAGVRLEDIGGNISVDTRRSDIVHCTNVAGTVDLRGKGENVELTKIAGQVTIEGEYSDTIALRELTKPVHVEDRRTRFDVAQVMGEVRIEGGSVQAENILGPVKLDTHDTDVTLDGFSNGLEVSVEKGDIELKPGHVPLSNMAVHTHSGDIDLSLPQSANFSLTATTGHGDIDNEFGDGLQQRSDGHGAKLEGAVGNGPDLKIATERGSITVRKTSVGANSGSVSVVRAHSLPQTMALLLSR